MGLGEVVREETLERRLTSVFVGFREGRRQRQEGLKREGMARAKTRQDGTAWQAWAGRSRLIWRPGRMGLLLPQILATIYPFTGHPRPPRGLASASLSWLLSCPWSLHPLNHSILGTHRIHFHLWLLEDTTLSTLTVSSSSSSLGQFLANLHLTSSKSLPRSS